jgi:hypothetical protein
MGSFLDQSIVSEDVMYYFVVLSFIFFLLSTFLLLLFAFGSHIALPISSSFQAPISILIILSIIQGLLYFLSIPLFSYSIYFELITSFTLIIQILIYSLILLPAQLFLEFRKSSEKIKKVGSSISPIVMNILAEIEKEPIPTNFVSLSVIKKAYLLALGLRKLPAYTLWVKEGDQVDEEEKLDKEFRSLMIKITVFGIVFYAFTAIRVSLFASKNLDSSVVEVIYGVLRIIFGMIMTLWLFKLPHSLRKFLKRQNYVYQSLNLVLPSFFFHVEKSITEMICFFSEDNNSEKHFLGALWTYFLLSINGLPLALLMLRAFSTEGIHLEEYKEFLKENDEAVNATSSNKKITEGQENLLDKNGQENQPNREDSFQK